MRAWRPFVALLLVVGLVAWTSIATAGPLDFRIGTDDVLAISVWSEKDLDQVVSVRPDGKISLPLVGETEAGGLTVAELASRLTTMYRRIVPGAQVTVAVREIRSRRHVFFLGGVVRPGPMQLTEELTILQALSAVGGPLPTADLESVFVLRGVTRIPVNLQKIQEGDLAQNLRLQPGDTVVVPSRLVCPSVDCVWVSGAVNAPGPVQYTKDLTIKTAIEAAGGFTPYASRRVIIRRGHRPEDALLLPSRPVGIEEMFLDITPNISPRPVPTVRNDAPKKEAVRIELKLDLGVNVNANIPLEPNDVIIIVGPQRLF